MPVGGKSGIEMPTSYRMRTKYDPVTVAGRQHTLFPTGGKNKENTNGIGSLKNSCHTHQILNSHYTGHVAKGFHTAVSLVILYFSYCEQIPLKKTKTNNASNSLCI